MKFEGVLMVVWCNWCKDEEDEQIKKSINFLIFNQFAMFFFNIKVKFVIV